MTRLAQSAEFEGYVDLIEAARVLEIHPQSLRRLIKRGEAPARLVFGKYVFRRDMLDQFRANYSPKPGRKLWPRRLV